ncbi:MAG: hypothetical protein IPK70_10385 [Flavobacteriales bacterium]|nr:hypothetical protein [Flavobacteriales bacterium]
MLYHRLDEIKDEAERQKFTMEVTDRFGPIPPLVNELLEAIRLRWLGQRMGLEKMVLKKGTLIGTNRGPEASVLRGRWLQRRAAGGRRNHVGSRCMRRRGRCGPACRM